MKSFWILSSLTAYLIALTATAEATLSLDPVQLEDRPRPANNFKLLISRRSIPAGHYDEKMPEAHLFDGEEGTKDGAGAGGVAHQSQYPVLEEQPQLQLQVPELAKLEDANGRTSEVLRADDNWMPPEGGIELNKVPPAVGLAFWAELLKKHSAKKGQTDNKILDSIYNYVQWLRRKAGLKTGGGGANNGDGSEEEVQQEAVVVPSLNHTGPPAAPLAAAAATITSANATEALLAPLVAAAATTASANTTEAVLAPLAAGVSVSSTNAGVTRPVSAPLAAVASSSASNHTAQPPAPLAPPVSASSNGLNHTGPPAPKPLAAPTNHTSEDASKASVPAAPSTASVSNQTSLASLIVPIIPSPNAGELPKGFSTASAVQPEIIVAPVKTDPLTTEAPPAVVSTSLTTDAGNHTIAHGLLHEGHSNLNGSLPLGYSTASSSQPFVQEGLVEVPKGPEITNQNSTKEPAENPPIFSLLLDPEGSDLTFRHHGNGREREFAAQILQMGIQGHRYPVMVVQPYTKAKADFDFDFEEEDTPEDGATTRSSDGSDPGPAFTIHLPLQQSHSQFQIPRLSFTMPVLFLPGLVFSQSENLEKNAHELQVRFPEPGTDYGVFPISHVPSRYPVAAETPSGGPEVNQTSIRPLTLQVLEEVPEVEGGKGALAAPGFEKGPADPSKDPSWGLSLNALFNASAHVESPKPNVTSAKGPQMVVTSNIFHSQTPGASHHGTSTVWFLNGGGKPQEVPQPTMQVTINHQVAPVPAETHMEFESPAAESEEAQESEPTVSEPVPEAPEASLPSSSSEEAPKCPPGQNSVGQVASPDGVVEESKSPEEPEEPPNVPEVAEPEAPNPEDLQVPHKPQEGTNEPGPDPNLEDPQTLPEQPEHPGTFDPDHEDPSPSHTNPLTSWPPKPPTEDPYFSTSNFKPLTSYPSLHHVPIVSQAAQNLGLPLNPFRPPQPLAYDTSLDDILSSHIERLNSLYYSKVQNPPNSMSPQEYASQLNRQVQNSNPPKSYQYMRGGSDPNFQRPPAAYTTKYFHDAQDPGPNLVAQLQDALHQSVPGTKSADLHQAVFALTSGVQKMVEQNKQLLELQKSTAEGDSEKYRFIEGQNFNQAPAAAAKLPLNWDQIKAMIDAYRFVERAPGGLREDHVQPATSDNWTPPSLDDFLRSSNNNNYPKSTYYNVAPPAVKLGGGLELTKPAVAKPSMNNPFRRPAKPKPRDKLEEATVCGVAGDELCAATCDKLQFKKGSCLSLHGGKPECVCSFNDENSEVAFNVEFLHGDSHSSQPTSAAGCQATSCTKSCLMEGFLMGRCDGATCVCGRSVVL